MILTSALFRIGVKFMSSTLFAFFFTFAVALALVFLSYIGGGILTGNVRETEIDAFVLIVVPIISGCMAILVRFFLMAKYSRIST